MAGPKAPDPTCQVVPVGTPEVLRTHDADLCLPSFQGTLWSSVLLSSFTLVGLVSLGHTEGEMTLLWRLLGVAFLFYIPILWLSAPYVRNYVFWALPPSRSLVSLESTWSGKLRAVLLPLCKQMAWACIFAP